MRIVAALLVFAAALFWLARRDSATYDEPQFLATGYHLWKTADFSFVPDSPVFPRLWLGLPLLRWDLDLASPPVGPDRNRPAAFFAYGKRFLFSQDVPADSLLLAGRLFSILLSLACGLAVFLWARGIGGEAGGWLGLAAFCLNPNVLAHGHLATADMAVTFWMLSAACGAWKMGAAPDPPAEKRKTWAGWLGVGVAFGLALCSKATALLLLPWLLVLTFYRRRDKILRLTLLLAGAFLAAALLYRGRLSYFAEAMKQIRVAAGPAPSPDWYQNYLFGKHSSEPFLHYYLSAFLLKTPAALLILYGAGVVFSVRRLRWNSIWLLGPAAAVLLAGSFSRIQIGIRYILPAIPFLAAACGSILSAEKKKAQEIGKSASRRGIQRKWPAIGCLLAFAEIAAAWPNSISYFNFLAGGASRGWRLLTDSNVDWGQEAKALAEYSRRSDGTLYYAYFGQDDPEYRGIRGISVLGSPIPPSSPREPSLPIRLGVSATYRAGLYLGDLNAFRWLDRRIPEEVLNGSILVYNLTADRPALEALAETLLRAGRPGEAEALRKAIASVRSR